MKVLVKELEIASRHLKLKREFIKLPAIDQKERYQGTCNIKKKASRYLQYLKKGIKVIAIDKKKWQQGIEI